jgi:hypothetical protein
LSSHSAWIVGASDFGNGTDLVAWVFGGELPDLHLPCGRIDVLAAMQLGLQLVEPALSVDLASE